ncbi:PfkB family carbohydrate kinase [Haloarcula sp. 1CSR25-25]|uniref:carbohydrate kinase family protein n=1 Tax=Haloarcula sp. 1CSR25-25 TaxID=2862545 RepID=UPI00289531CD|nr:PfkB family carbohydrate kinase [Haloarcula sp. 1CSR25-25]MDT3434821.1 carbohydrate kinase family protein [Haloarcula sp. 1CSR25-25]
MRVICAGHVNWDVTLRVDHFPKPDGEGRITDQSQSSGGSASNVAVALAGLEADPVVLGSVGRDDHGTMARRELTATGVETLLVESDQPTAVKYLIVDGNGDVAVLGNDGANEAFCASDLPAETLAEADHLHLTGQDPGTAATLARDAASADVPVSFDPGRRLPFRDYSAVLSHADILFCNDREADHARDRGLFETVSTVVVKHGDCGATAHMDDRTVTNAGYPIEPVDTAGAGDAFAAGYLLADARGTDPEGALAVANACGALAAQSTGAQTALDWESVWDLVDSGQSPETV